MPLGHRRQHSVRLGAINSQGQAGIKSKVGYSAKVLQHHARVLGVPETRSHEIIDRATSQLMIASEDSGEDFSTHEETMRAASCWIAARDLNVSLPFDLAAVAEYIKSNLDDLEHDVERLDKILALKKAEDKQFLEMQRDREARERRTPIETWSDDESQGDGSGEGKDTEGKKQVNHGDVEDVGQQNLIDMEVDRENV